MGQIYLLASLTLLLGCGKAGGKETQLKPADSGVRHELGLPDDSSQHSGQPAGFPQGAPQDSGPQTANPGGQHAGRGIDPKNSTARPSTTNDRDPTTGTSNSVPKDSSTSPTQSPRDEPNQSADIYEKSRNFRLPPITGRGPDAHLWATFYHTLRFQSLTSGFPLLSLSGVELGPRLSKLQWCQAAMEGSVQIFHNGSWKTYNYAGTGGSVQVDCTEYYDHPVGRTRFGLARGPYGDGVRNFILVPFRTIAVDPAVIPYGTVIYIEDARGLLFPVGDGQELRHDGYFFAGDTGGLIHDNHIDVFIGNALRSPFPWITSHPKSRIGYQVVKDPEISNALLNLHLQ